jgi:ceramide glucosyltransferase
MAVIALVAAALVAGSLVFCAMVVVAARRYLAVRPPELKAPQAVSILKPLSGADRGLEDNLRSYFDQDYPEFEILFAVRQAGDAAVPVVEKLMREFPSVPARLIFTGEPPYPNAKVFALDSMLAKARHDLIVMGDSDTRVTPSMLATLAVEFQDPRLGLATCPYRAVPGPTLWSALEAVGMNTEFWGGVLVARMLEGMKFGVGPAMAARREALAAMGGFDRVKDYLAEDFVMGKFIAEAGYNTILSAYVIEHHIGGELLPTNLAHRLRWNRSTRRSRPAGYVGQLFTYPLALALVATALRPGWWPLLAATAAVRALAAWAVAGWVLHDPLTAKQPWLVPLQDLASFTFWIAGFFGNTITWRGRRYVVLPDGRFELTHR